MELLLASALEVLAFDALIARTADAPIQLMVMSLTIWGVIYYVEGCGLERLNAGFANKAILMVATCQTPIGGGD